MPVFSRFSPSDYPVLRPYHPREHLVATAKVAHPQLELPAVGLPDLPAPLGAAVESALVRRRRHPARGTRADSGRAVVGVAVDDL